MATKMTMVRRDDLDMLVEAADELVTRMGLEGIKQSKQPWYEQLVATLERTRARLRIFGG